MSSFITFLALQSCRLDGPAPPKEKSTNLKYRIIKLLVFPFLLFIRVVTVISSDHSVTQLRSYKFCEFSFFVYCINPQITFKPQLKLPFFRKKNKNAVKLLFRGRFKG